MGRSCSIRSYLSITGVLDTDRVFLRTSLLAPWFFVVVRFCDPHLGRKHILKFDRTKATDICTASPQLIVVLPAKMGITKTQCPNKELLSNIQRKLM